MKDLTLDQCLEAYRNVRRKNKWSDDTEQFLIKNGWENLHAQIKRHVDDWDEFLRLAGSWQE